MELLVEKDERPTGHLLPKVQPILYLIHQSPPLKCGGGWLSNCRRRRHSK